MPELTAVLEIDKPHFTVRLYESMLRIDLKGSFKNEIEEALENRPILRETVGSILGIFVPLHLRLRDIDSARMDRTGKVRVSLPLHRDIVIPLERRDGERLVDTLNQFIRKAKNKEIRERIMRKRARREREKSKRVPSSSYVTVPYYFPTEQVDIVGKLRPRKKRRKK